MRHLLEESQTKITWTVFTNAVYQKYFPPSVRNTKELEFMQPRPGNRTISEYIAKFEKLCRFSTIYQRNPDEPGSASNLREDYEKIFLHQWDQWRLEMSPHW